LNSFQYGVKGDLAESVDAAGDQQDRFAAFDLAHPIRSVGNSIEHVRL
jgi:hypothetical protein